MTEVEFGNVKIVLNEPESKGFRSYIIIDRRTVFHYSFDE